MSGQGQSFFERVATLQREGQEFAVAQVVARRAPVSSHLGDRAIVYTDGRIDGFVGGACSREIVRRQALEALAHGHPRLVQIRPEGIPPGFVSDAEHVVVPMSCASEGAVDLYIEPYRPAPLLMVVGFSPVAEALARIAETLAYHLVRVVSTAEVGDLAPTGAPVVTLERLDDYLAQLPPERAAALSAVVASQGHYDEPALEALLRVQPRYLGLLASRRRGALARHLLRDGGCTESAVAAIHSPVGLDLGATSPGEVAVSILAQIIERNARANAPRLEELLARPVQPLASAIDPVCGMHVEVLSALHTSVLDGHPYYFCCASCKATFMTDPVRYLEKADAR